MRRWYLGFGAVLLAGGAASGFVPLLDNAGWELAAVFALPAALLGGFTAIAGVRIARGAGRALHPVHVWLLGCVPALLPLVLAFGLAAAHALRGSVRNCTPLQSVAFFGLMPLASAAFAAALGVAIARSVRSHRTAAALFLLVFAGSFASTLAGIFPDVFATNHFFGWFPGPLYDEAVPLGAALFYLRLLSALLALSVLLASALFPEQAPAAGHAPDAMPPLLFAGSRRHDAAALVVVLIALAIAMGFRRELGIDIRRSDVQAGLGGHVRTEHFDIWYPAGLDPERVRLLVEDHEYRWHTVTTHLGVTPERRVTSYVFPDHLSKKRWTGAGITQIANPYQGEMYLNGADYPHRVLEHELAHVVSAEFGSPWLFSMTSRIGLLEGVAVATAWHDLGRGTPHEQSAAMLREGLLPPARNFLGLGFWADRQARAYTAAGSFVRFLGERYGMDKVRAAYARAGIEETFGRTTADLDREWREYLSAIPVPPAKETAARERFTQPSLFERPCARELARLEQEGWSMLRQARHGEAIALFETWRAVDDRVEPVRALYHATVRRGDLAQAESFARILVAREIEGSPMWWRAKVYLAEVAWAAGRLEEAEAGFAEVLDAAVTSDLAREAWIKRDAVRRARSGETALADAIRDWFSPIPGSNEARLARLTRATIAAEGSAAFSGSYLLGLSMVHTEPAEAVFWLDRAAAAAGDVDNATLLAELHARRADGLTRERRLDEAREAWQRVLDLPGAPADVRSRAEDGLRRIEWLRAYNDATASRKRPTE